MQAIRGGIKSYPITMVKNSVVFIIGDTNDSWEKFKDTPLIYLGVHHSGQMMFETPGDGVIYLNCPTVGCVIPPEYVKYTFLEPEPEELVDELGDESGSIDNTADFEVYKAKDTDDVSTFQAILRAAALSLDLGELGEQPDSMMIIFGQDETYQYRPVGMSKAEQLYCLEWCKNNLMDLAQFSDLGEPYEDDEDC